MLSILTELATVLKKDLGLGGEARGLDLGRDMVALVVVMVARPMALYSNRCIWGVVVVMVWALGDLAGVIWYGR